ncbi:hypothetical protein B1218_36635, partial [Pseudomonas ogarae]
GLVAAGLYPNPLPYADVVTTTTHKTLRRPPGGLILAKAIAEIAKKRNAALLPRAQGGPMLPHIPGPPAPSAIPAAAAPPADPGPAVSSPTSAKLWSCSTSSRRSYPQRHSNSWASPVPT